jgi:uncharacterized damage-inducible protein DinB
MQADQIRKLFDYHFASIHKLWDRAVDHLDDDQFSQEVKGYGGSVHRQLVHMSDIDRSWISVLAGEEWLGTQDHTNFPDKESVRAYAEQSEALVRGYLERLNDETLTEIFSKWGKELQVWEVLIHMIGHGIDHRSLLLTMLNQLGVETFEQDYVLYAFGGSWPSEG